MKRREFIILTGVGATSATMLGACGNPENKLIPALIPDDEYVPGIDYWKASTCAMCPAGCGIIVRTREHKANKIEGNPLHPVNRGALCARGQAGLQVLYNPDRIKGPMKRAGERGEGKWEEISWDEAIKTLADKLRETKAQGRADSALFVTDVHNSVDALVGQRFMEAYGSSAHLTLPQFFDDDVSYGPRVAFDLAHATYLLSFGARFLETWQSPVTYSLAYGAFRQTSGRARGRFVHVEPRMSLTAANADEWLPAAVGTEGVVALGIAQVIIREGLSRAASLPTFARPIDDYAPEKAADKTGIPAERLVRIAREFASAERPLAICSRSVDAGTAGYNNSTWVGFLNTLVDNHNKKGGVLRERDYFDPFEKLLSRLSDSWNTVFATNFPETIKGREDLVLLIHQVNPAYMTPEVRDELKAVQFIASFSSFMDETTHLADLILPDNTYLESWDLTRPFSIDANRVVSLTQPVVKPDVNTRQTADVFIALSREIGGEVEQAIPFTSAEEIIKRAAEDLAKTTFATAVDGSAELASLTERGFWKGETTSTDADAPVEPRNVPGAQMPKIGPDGGSPSRAEVEELLQRLGVHVEGELSSSSKGDEAEYPLHLLMYEQSTFGDGSMANLPLLQELPDPMTSVMWGSWVEINPVTAAQLGIADGDPVDVTTERGSVLVPAVVYPGIRPDVIAIPYGQGHVAYGRFATGRGINPALFNPWYQRTVRARVTKASTETLLIRFGTSLPEKIETKR
ncbi:MAG TPA: molybdopterin-dependent oxidoreductase [Blastocatellia bacterium]|nr:molybdopterin-dependent oxidoreductase [Blastocatellia bacterium]